MHSAASVLVVMRTRNFLFAVVLCGLQIYCSHGGASSTKPASDYFDICHSSVPDFDECVIRSLRKLKPRLIEGIPELDIIPVDPLTLPRIETTDGSGGFILKVIMKNITIHGMSNLKIRHFSMERNLPKAVLHFNVTVPFLRFTANYEVDGRVLLVPVRGNGDGEGNFTQIFASGSIFGQKVSRNGKNYMNVDDMKWKIDITGDSHVQINNLFGGDKVLGEATNKIFNENWKDIFVAYRGVVEETFSVIFRDLCNKVFTHFTFEELYPD